MARARLYARYGHALVASLFLAAVVAQFFLAGMALFTTQSWHAHVDTGYFAALGVLGLLPLGLLARLPLGELFLTVTLALAAWVQVLLPHLTPWVAAFHPLFALVVLALAALVAARSVASARGRAPRRTAPPRSSP